MIKMKVFSVFLLLVVSVACNPIEYKELNDLSNALKSYLQHYQALEGSSAEEPPSSTSSKALPRGKINIHKSKSNNGINKPLDSESKSLMYDYYANTMGPIYKRNFDEIDRMGFNGFNKRNFDEIERMGFNGFNKRNFDEIDRNSFNGFKKRYFDEIDRPGFDEFRKKSYGIKTSPSAGYQREEIYGAYPKRNFDEIDRFGFDKFYKRDFDEIDRLGFNSF